MAQYGTIEYYKKEMEEEELEKEIYLNALENIARKDFKNYYLIEVVAEKITSCSSSIKFYANQIEELLKAETHKEESGVE